MFQDVEYRDWRKDRRTLVAATFHLISLILTVTSLVELPWFQVIGCNPSMLGPKYFLSIAGHFHTEIIEPEVEPHQPTPTTALDVSIKYHSDTNVLECISGEVLCLMRLLALLCIVCIISTMVGFCLDIIGPVKRPLRFLRRNAVASVLAVVCIISMICVSYFLTSSLEEAGKEQHKDAVIHVSYDSGFYAIAAAGCISLIATGCNILQDPGVSVLSRHGRMVATHDHFVDDYFTETFTIPHPTPPPPYEP